MIVKLLEVCIAGVIVAIISMVVLIIAIIMAEFSEDIADWIREKVLKKKRGAR